MRYVLSFVATDGYVNSNVLWHAAFLLSKTDEQGRLEVIDNWSFYGVPTTGDRKTLLNQLKIKAGLDVDLIGNHGWLRHEDIRFLDAGIGLHGKSFELTKEQFDRLQAMCIQMVKDQEEAVKEVITQELTPKPEGKYRIYPHEEYSQKIYEIEKMKAKKSGREPRLKPFELRFTVGLDGMGVHHSHTCKSNLVSILAKVLSPAQIATITGNGSHPTIPRFSGAMEDFYLYSTGPFKTHKKSDGSIVYYRDGNDPEVKLYWVLPPQELDAMCDDTYNRFLIDKEHVDELKTVVGQLIRLEWVFRNATVEEKYKPLQKAMLQDIIRQYTSFMDMQSKEAPIGGMTGWGLTLFSLPRNKEEKVLMDKIKASKQFINNLYLAIEDGWVMDETEPDLESLAFVLPIASKIQLCNAIGKTYFDPELRPEYVDEDRAKEIEAQVKEPILSHG
jgi:hypothetical protein